MRKIFSEEIKKIGLADPSVVFLTGDLGYGALEDVRASFGDRFINTGVAEQNMIGVAAGMARRGYKVFCYSIAPFIVYRCLEQTRNDVCLHRLPVFLVGNGGGYGYGIMGSSHHALEDIACLSPLQHMNCHVPAFSEDVAPALHTILNEMQPAYLRLGMGKSAPDGYQRLTAFSEVMRSEKPKATLLAMGPVVHNMTDSIKKNNFAGMFDVFTAARFPIPALDQVVIESVKKSGRLLIAEEHVAAGGCAQQFLFEYLKHAPSPASLLSLHAAGYPGKVYGDQAFHQQQSGLDEASITAHLKNWVSSS